MRLPVEVSHSGATLGAGRTTYWVNTNAIHGRQVDHEAAITHGVASHAVAAPADRHEQVVGTRKIDGSDHVRYACAAGNQRRALVDHCVVDLAGLIVAFVARK